MISLSEKLSLLSKIMYQVHVLYAGSFMLMHKLFIAYESNYVDTEDRVLIIFFYINVGSDLLVAVDFRGPVTVLMFVCPLSSV